MLSFFSVSFFLLFFCYAFNSGAGAGYVLGLFIFFPLSVSPFSWNPEYEYSSHNQAFVVLSSSQNLQKN